MRWAIGALNSHPRRRKMPNNLTPERSARHQILDLACEVSLYRVVGRPCFYELVERARHVAQAAAREGVPLHTPLTELFIEQQHRYGSGETLGWHYRRAYCSVDASLDPMQFFSITYANNLMTIESRRVRGASGEIVLNESSLDQIIACVEYDTPQSYNSWAPDEHPVGGAPLLLRIDDDQPQVGQLCLEAGDLHPCRGSLYFGEQVQESEQMTAFCRLGALVHALFAENRPTTAQRANAEKRASEIIGKASSFCFFPSSGFCYSCGADVTEGVTNLAAAASKTGCHLCGGTWCD
jgi:hypothetical protein